MNEITYRLDLSPQMLGVIGEALAAQPYKLVAKVLEAIQAQVTQQDQARNGIQMGAPLTPAGMMKAANGDATLKEAHSGNT